MATKTEPAATYVRYYQQGNIEHSIQLWSDGDVIFYTKSLSDPEDKGHVSLSIPVGDLPYLTTVFADIVNARIQDEREGYATDRARIADSVLAQQVLVLKTTEDDE